MNNCAICFSGQIASGKTTISLALSQKYNWRYASFGDYVHFYAKNLGMDPTDRCTLQLTGQQLINKGWKNFCINVLDFASWNSGENLVIDGVRHLAAIETIKEIVSPLDVFVVFVHVDEITRVERLLKRGMSYEYIYNQDNNPIEAETKNAILDSADLILDGTKSIASNLDQVEAWVKHKQKVD